MTRTGGSVVSRSPSRRRFTRSPSIHLVRRPPTCRTRPTPPRVKLPVRPCRRPAGVSTPTVKTWTVNGQLIASNNSGLTFKAPPRPWYRTKQATIALVAAASAAVVVPVVLLVLPSSPAPHPRSRHPWHRKRRRLHSPHPPACSPLRSTLPRHRHRPLLLRHLRLRTLAQRRRIPSPTLGHRHQRRSRTSGSRARL